MTPDLSWCPTHNLLVSGIDVPTCNDLLGQATRIGFVPANGMSLLNVRVTDGPILDTLREKLAPLVPVLNNNYGFDLFEAPKELIPVASFFKLKTDDWYHRHSDLGGKCPTRKLTVLVKLSDYHEGGDLILHEDEKPTPFKDQPVGTTVAFPPWISSEVTLVRSSMSFFLMTWLHGPRFK
jgi:hypothetical protein